MAISIVVPSVVTLVSEQSLTAARQVEMTENTGCNRYYTPENDYSIDLVAFPKASALYSLLSKRCNLYAPEIQTGSAPPGCV